jgi:hypothetical protein
MEKRRNWAKSIIEWFEMVFYNYDMGICQVIILYNKFQDMQKTIQGHIKTCKEFPRLYRITYPKLVNTLKLSCEV